MDTTDVLIGVLLVGAGVALGYGAYKDVPMFGPDGLITEAIRTGKLQALPKSSQGVGLITPGAQGQTVGGHPEIMDPNG